jgi:hypothetical protein
MPGEVYAAKPVLKGTRTEQKPVFSRKLLQFLGSGVINVIKPHLIMVSVYSVEMERKDKTSTANILHVFI